MIFQPLAMLLFAAPAGDLTPMGSPQTMPWGKAKPGYIFGAEAILTFKIDGDDAIMLELRGEDSLKGKGVHVEIVRDATFNSTNEVFLTPMPGGPGKLHLGAKLGFRVPAGQHQYLISADVAGLVLRAVTAKSIPKTSLVADEKDLAKTIAVTTTKRPAAARDRNSEQAELESITHEANKMALGADTLSAKPGAALVGQAPLRVAVYDLEVQGLSAHIGAVVTDSLLAEVRKLQGISAIGMAEIRDMLSMEASKQLVGCADNTSCLADIAGALGVDDLITGSISRVGEGSIFVVRRLDQRQAKIRGTLEKRLKAGAGDEFLAAIGSSVQELFPERDLKVGKQRGVAKEVAMRIDPPPLPKWSWYSVAGGAVAAAAVGGVLEWMAQDRAKQYRDYANVGLTTPISGSRLTSIGRDAQGRADAARYTFVGAGIFALASGIMSMFTDWYGYHNQ